MNNINVESPAVHSYLTILQNVIGRMATDSSACKTWCITLVSAIVVVVATEGKPTSIWIALIPLILFLFLDTYYLTLERLFRRRYDSFIKKVQDGTVLVDDTFIVTPVESPGKHLFAIGQTAGSFSVWPFYVMLLIMLLITRYVVLID